MAPPLGVEGRACRKDPGRRENFQGTLLGGTAHVQVTGQFAQQNHTFSSLLKKHYLPHKTIVQGILDSRTLSLK